MSSFPEYIRIESLTSRNAAIFIYRTQQNPTFISLFNFICHSVQFPRFTLLEIPFYPISISRISAKVEHRRRGAMGSDHTTSVIVQLRKVAIAGTSGENVDVPLKKKDSGESEAKTERNVHTSFK